MATSPKKKTSPGVSKTEFVAFQKETRDGLGTILDILEGMKGGAPVAKTTEAVEPHVEEADFTKPDREEQDGDPNGFLPPQYQRIFAKYFDPEDGFEARLNFPEVDEQGRELGGITFTISVPMKFSNTDDAYRKLYKQDLRTRALLPHNIAKGIEEWCVKVQKNLRYDRGAVRKS